MIRAGLHRLLRRASARYIAGPELSDAKTLCQKLSLQGFSTTLGFWDSGNEPPQLVAQQYINSFDAAREQGTSCYVSVKLTGFGFDRELEQTVLQLAAKKRIRVHFDSQSPAIADQIFSLLEERIRTAGNPQMLGCTLPGRWRRSIRDSETVVRLGLPVRVVKGQWEDVEGPAIDPREGFLKVIDCLAGRACYVAVATHDPKLASQAFARLRETNTPCGLELLLGLPSQHMLKLAAHLSVPVRFYVPYGHAWLPYALRQLKRNPRILIWIARDLLASRTKSMSIS